MPVLARAAWSTNCRRFSPFTVLILPNHPFWFLCPQRYPEGDDHISMIVIRSLFILPSTHTGEALLVIRLGPAWARCHRWSYACRQSAARHGRSIPSPPRSVASIQTEG